MKVLKLFFVAFTLIVAFSSISNAQTNDKPMKLKKTPEQVAEKKAKKMQEKLGLSSDQYSQVYTIFYNSAMDRQSRSNMSKEDRKAYKQQINSQIEGILTADQLVQWQKYKSDHKGKHKNKNKDKGKSKRESQGMFFKKEPCPEK